MKTTNNAPRFSQMYVSLLLDRDNIDTQTERYALNGRQFLLEIVRFSLAFNIMDLLVGDALNFFEAMLWFALFFIPVYAMLVLPIWAYVILRKSAWKKIQKPDSAIGQKEDHIHVPHLTLLSQWKCKICHKDIRPINKFYDYIPFLVTRILFYPSLYFLTVSHFNFVINICFYIVVYFIICYGFLWILHKLLFSKSLFQLEEYKKGGEN